MERSEVRAREEEAMTDSDLIRRGDVRFLLASTVDIEDADFITLRCRLDALPADPVAVAAIRLAEAMDAGEQEVGQRWLPFLRDYNAGSVALLAYRSALAERQTNVPGKSAGDGDRT